MPLTALIFTCERKLTSTFARAVADLPLDWILISDKGLAERLIVQEHLDILLVDTAAEGGPALIAKAGSCEANDRPIIFALASGPVNEALLQLGADVYLPTPTDEGALAHHIAHELGVRRKWVQADKHL